MTWFEVLTGFRETSPEQVREKITVRDDTLMSLTNGKQFQFGRLETPTLAELRDRVRADENGSRRIVVREVVADVKVLHANESNAGSLFQVASQFNLLEMVSPGITPEHGVAIYENDRTQGPACAIAAGAGTVYRNYFAPVNGFIGQSEANQIDCLADLGMLLNNSDFRLWEMRNGYALASRDGLVVISDRLRSSSDEELDQLRLQLRIGIQWNTQVTLKDCKHTVTQAYCSALPVAYSRHPADLWKDFARLVLEAAYEATICTAILNAVSTGNNRVFLTLLGGGAFGNETDWITDGIRRTLARYQNFNLDVAIVSHGASRPEVRQLVEDYSR